MKRLEHTGSRSSAPIQRTAALSPKSKSSQPPVAMPLRPLAAFVIANDVRAMIQDVQALMLIAPYPYKGYPSPFQAPSNKRGKLEAGKQGNTGNAGNQLSTGSRESFKAVRYYSRLISRFVRKR